jgi:serine/alanine adding enzyme
MLEENGLAELAVFKLDDNFCFHPYIKRKTHLESHCYDIISAYDFGGFWFSTRDPSIQKDLLNYFSKTFSSYCKENNIVTEFIRFYPFSDLLDPPGYDVSLVENNVIVSLDQTDDEIKSAYHHSLRADLKKANSYDQGMDRDISPSTFVKLYHKNLDLLKSELYYYFPVEFFENLPNMQSVCLKDLEGDITAAHVYLRDGPVLFYYLSTSNRDLLYKKPNDLLLNNMFFEAKNEGFKTLHMGGGRAESLVRYKKKFSKQTIPYFIGKKIFMHQKYKMLVQLKEDQLKTRFDDNTFFPLYRCERS